MPVDKRRLAVRSPSYRKVPVDRPCRLQAEELFHRPVLPSASGSDNQQDSTVRESPMRLLSGKDMTCVVEKSFYECVAQSLRVENICATLNWLSAKRRGVGNIPVN